MKINFDLDLSLLTDYWYVWAPVVGPALWLACGALASRFFCADAWRRADSKRLYLINPRDDNTTAVVCGVLGPAAFIGAIALLLGRSLIWLLARANVKALYVPKHIREAQLDDY